MSLKNTTRMYCVLIFIYAVTVYFSFSILASLLVAFVIAIPFGYTKGDDWFNNAGRLVITTFLCTGAGYQIARVAQESEFYRNGVVVWFILTATIFAFTFKK